MIPGKNGRFRSLYTPLILPIMIFLALTGEPVSAASSLKVMKITNEYNEPMLKYNCSYPRVSGMKNIERQQRINVILKEKAETSVQMARFVSKNLNGDAEPSSKQGSSKLEQTGDSAQAPFVTGKFEYEIKRNENGFLSLVLKDRLFAGGGKESITQTSETMDTVAGRSYRLGSLFTEHADYVGVLSREVERQIRLKGLEAKQHTDFKKINSDEDFYLTNDSLVIYFAQYEYFPYEYGIQEFSIPLKSLDGILRPEIRL